jgi:hypothetical protein
MKIRKDRSFYSCTPYPKMLILSEKDPVLPYEESKTQTENSAA